MLSRALASLLLPVLATLLKADRAADKLPDQVRPIPPPGIPIPQARPPA